ncbi:hypothetical protein MNV49_000664 [Pseudohyphozyma bogoriensis]|nr:hypothetical protein MNV49_000664 [Pseudohyphozyma bogoriensis]
MSPAPIPVDLALHDAQLFEEVVSNTQVASSSSSGAAPAAAAAASANVANKNPFFDAFRDPQLRVHQPTSNPTDATSNLMLTENAGLTHASTLSATLDLFTSLGQVDAGSLRTLLVAAWNEDPLLTLKIIFSTRSIPRGKGSKEGFARGAAFLAEEHPQTLLRNLEQLVRPSDLIPQKKRKATSDAPEEEDEEDDDDMGEDDLCDVPVEPTPATARSHGTFKDLLDLLYFSSLASISTASKTQLSVEGDFSRLPGYEADPASPFIVARSKRAAFRTKVETPAAETSLETLMAGNTLHRSLHLTVARLFGIQLQKDLDALTSATQLRAAGRIDEARVAEGKISLAAKWAPTEKGSHDRQTGIATSIAEFLTPPSDGERTTSSLQRALGRYRSTFLAPLRKHLEIVEVKMSANKWEDIKYSRVPSLAMSKHRKLFHKHDAEGFGQYLVKVAEGKATISGAVMTPAVLLKQATESHRGDDVGALVANAQWKTLVDGVRDTGKLSRCIAVADVSGSMMSPMLADQTSPLHSSIALSILVAQVTAPPFANSIISFSESPRFIDLTGTTLAELWEQCQAGMGYNTDFIAVFREILRRAVAAKITQEQMVERIFVFSDMEFDEAGSHHRHSFGGESGGYATHYDTIVKEFGESGYVVPELVFWNLASRQKTMSKPVTAQQPGVALVSGYSAAMVKVFLEGGEFGEEAEKEEGSQAKVGKEPMTPEQIMRKAIGHESFAGLKVFD